MKNADVYVAAADGDDDYNYDDDAHADVCAAADDIYGDDFDG